MQSSSRSKKHNVYPNSGHRRSIISYIGGKAQLVDNIVPIIDYAIHGYHLNAYYELCGGGARMLINLPHSNLQKRVYNDIDEGLAALFTCLTQPTLLYNLMTTLDEWGVSEERYQWVKQLRESSRIGDEGYDVITAAACAYVINQQSRAATQGSYDRSSLTPNRMRSYFRRVRELDKFLTTMLGVEVTNRDVFSWLQERRDWSKSFIYLDPPYVPDQMHLDDHYNVNWTRDDHERLVNVLLTHQGTIALSGYDNDVYSRLVDKGWTKIYLKRVHVSSAAIGRFQDEYLWINFVIPTTLLDQVSEIDYSRW